MEVVGGENLIELGPDHEGPHPQGDHEFWQESVVLVWWDLDQNVGGYHRIGHEPNWRDGPHFSLWNNLWSPEWLYKNSVFMPMQDEDRNADGFGAGDTCSFRYIDNKAIWTVDDTDVSAKLVVSDFHPPVDVYPKDGGSLGGDFAPNHMEVSSSVTGTVSIKGKRYQVNGVGFRDHGWGKREWQAIVSHRWVVGTFGPDFSVLAMTFVGSDNVLKQIGCVIREGKLTYAKDVDILTYMEADGLTHRGGSVKMTLTTGEVLDFECEVIAKGVVSWIHGIACVDTPCRMTCGERVGFCDFEMTNNALRGNYRPYFAMQAIEKNGLHKL
jgi:hypothetical protein